MPRQGKNIYQHKDGRWEGRYSKGKIDGKYRYGSVFGKTYDEVEQKLDVLKSENSNIEKQKEITRKSECFPLAPQTGLDSRACGRLVARGRNSPPDCCSVPLVLRVR